MDGAIALIVPEVELEPTLLFDLCSGRVVAVRSFPPIFKFFPLIYLYINLFFLLHGHRYSTISIPIYFLFMLHGYICRQ
jgi:hypothetical protein